MTQPLIRAMEKVAIPESTLGYEGDIPVVPGNASVPIELRIRGVLQDLPVGAHIVFVIDNSGSMGPDSPHSDPDKKRFSAIQMLSDAFASTRNALDRVAIVTFQGSELDGDLEVRLDTPDAPWKTWTEAAARVPHLPPEHPGGKTPIAAAMQKANALLKDSNSFYRLAILISDGLPLPDDDTWPQTSTIVNDIVPNECVPNRIIYSTIYLYTQPPEDSALLMYIARHTDYISPYQAGDPPAFYFRITSPNEIVTAYQGLFETVKERVVPQDVRIAEHVNSRLVIDSDAPATFSGAGFVEERNLLGDVPLDALLAQFRSTRQLLVHLNELAGEVVLRFSVKLNLASVTDAEYASGSVDVEVDIAADSTISWLEPVNPTGALMRTLGLPQALIKFRLGLHVTKALDENGSTVRIDVSNLDFRPLTGFQLAEYPSSYVDVASVSDDFAFQPFRMLHRNRIGAWFLDHVPVAGLSQQARGTLMREVREALQIAHAPVLAKESVFDRYLCQFGFVETKPGTMVYDAYWNTPSQRGLYKAATTLPPRSTRTLTFDLGGATYLVRNGPDRMLAKPADALEPKGLWPKSEYTAQGLGDWKTVYPNPVHHQIATANPEADLFLRTCFSSAHLRELLPLLEGSALPNPWAMLDSGDITPIWTIAGRRPRIGASVKIYNSGDAPSAPTTLRVFCVYLPLARVDLTPPRRKVAPISVSAPFFGTADIAVPSVASHTAWTGVALFRNLNYLLTDSTAPIVDSAALQSVKDAIVITTVDIAQAENERMQCNNSAIEIAPLGLA